MAATIKTEGACKCGEAVTRFQNDPGAAAKDGTRYDYPDAKQLVGYTNNIFRCRGCSGVIYETWQERCANAVAESS